MLKYLDFIGVGLMPGSPPANRVIHPMPERADALKPSSPCRIVKLVSEPSASKSAG
jgi:hypothetical protein